jgi:hypothetical protein
VNRCPNRGFDRRLARPRSELDRAADRIRRIRNRITNIYINITRLYKYDTHDTHDTRTHPRTHARARAHAHAHAHSDGDSIQKCVSSVSLSHNLLISLDNVRYKRHAKTVSVIRCRCIAAPTSSAQGELPAPDLPALAGRQATGPWKPCTHRGHFAPRFFASADLSIRCNVAHYAMLRSGG